MKTTRFPSDVASRRATAILSLLLALFLIKSCNNKEPSSSVRTKYKDFIDTTISVYGPYIVVKLPITKGVEISNPIQLTLGPRKMLYAANQKGEVYTLRDTDDDGLEDSAVLYCDVRDFSLRSPSSIAFRGDTVYIGTAQQIRVFLDKDGDAKADTSWTFFDDIPHSEHPYEWTSGLTFGPDKWLYFNLTTDSWNAAPSPDPNQYRGAILRISPNGKKVEKVVVGIRSVHGMAFNANGDLFFTDNEGGGNPTEELNRVVKGSFYGHNVKKYGTDSVVGPDFVLKTEVAPSGIEFNNSDNDFGGTQNDLFVAFYGAGERWERGAIAHLKLTRSADGNYSYEEFPIADVPKISDLAFGNDGSLYLARHGKTDYWYNVVYDNQGTFYKMIYDPSIPRGEIKERKTTEYSFSKNSIEAGKQLYAEQACLACHQVDGVTELLGPNLKDVAGRLSREEILTEILKPSDRIKPSMQAVRVTKKDGQVMIGRVISSDEKELSLMIIGNSVVKIARNDIAKTENEMKSLMYEGLLNGLEDQQKDDLLNYVMSLSN